MKAFRYHAPSTLREAARLLADGDGAHPLAGGTDLIPQMKAGLRSPSLVLDLKRIPELNRLEFDPKKGLTVGAAASCTKIADFPPVGTHYPMLGYACRLIGSVQIQNRASLGGNVCNAAPSADGIPPLLCLNAVAHTYGPAGRRRVPVHGFFVGPGKTVLVPGELLVSLQVPIPPRRSAGAYLRFTPRDEMDIAVAGVGSLVALNSRGRCKEARIALCAVAPTPIRATEAEAFLKGKRLDDATLLEAGHLAAAASRPISDVRGSRDYRRHLVQVLTMRTLRQIREQLTKPPPNKGATA